MSTRGITRPGLIVLVSILLVASGAGGYWLIQLQPSPVPPTSRFPVTIQDDLGRNVTLTQTPLRVVSVVPSNTEIVFAIGGAAKLVGVDRFSKFPPELEQMKRAGNITEVGGGFDPDIEKIVSLRPDLILGNGPSQRKVLQKLEDLGLPIIYLRPRTLNELYDNIRLLGKVLSREENGADLIRRMQERVQAIVEKVKTLPRVKVYMEVWNDPLMSIGPETLPEELVHLAGGINLFGDLSEKGKSPVVNAEAIVQKNPDVIILVHPGNTPAQVKTRAGWDIIKAVRENRVHAMDGIFVAPVPRLVDGLEQIARFLHPEAFR